MERISDELINFKIAVIGDSMAGKTSVLLRYIHGCFDEGYNQTAGASILNKQVTEKNKILKLTFYDLSGNPKFNSTRGLYYKNMEAYMIVISFDQDSSQLLKNLQDWYKVIEEYVTSDVPVFVVINKKDCFEGKSSAEIQQIEVWADANFATIYKVSAKTGENIHDCFESLVKSLTKTCLTRTKNSLRLSKEKQNIRNSQSKCCY